MFCLSALFYQIFISEYKMKKQDKSKKTNDKAVVDQSKSETKKDQTIEIIEECPKPSDESKKSSKKRGFLDLNELILIICYNQ